MSHILAIDQGTSSSRVIIFDAQGRQLTAVQHEFDMTFPADGWVEAIVVGGRNSDGSCAVNPLSAIISTKTHTTSTQPLNINPINIICCYIYVHARGVCRSKVSIGSIIIPICLGNDSFIYTSLNITANYNA